jgi:uncharacterized protein (DUF952 family)/ribosomal protein S18 acetylase RimI-like enzyme
MGALIYKICARSEWESAVAEGVYRGSAVDHRDGFIHFSQPDQVDETLRKHFAGQRDLVRIGVEPGVLGAALRYEASRGGALFPHLYGTLDVSVAREVIALEPVPLQRCSVSRIRETRPEDDRLIARHFYRMWRDNDVAPERLRADWEARVVAFVAAARRDSAYRGFIAELEGIGIVGSTSCQLFTGLYPDVLEPAHRLYGYLWGVYVEPDHRRRGIARDLTQAALDYLRSIGCSQVRLHASPAGRPVYAELGFEATNEMRLALIR